MKVMTVSLPCRAHSGWHAGIARWARSMLREFPLSPPNPFHGPRGIAGRGRGWGRGAIVAHEFVESLRQHIAKAVSLLC